MAHMLQNRHVQPRMDKIPLSESVFVSSQHRSNVQSERAAGLDVEAKTNPPSSFPNNLSRAF